MTFIQIFLCLFGLWFFLVRRKIDAEPLMWKRFLLWAVATNFLPEILTLPYQAYRLGVWVTMNVLGAIFYALVIILLYQIAKGVFFGGLSWTGIKEWWADAMDTPSKEMLEKL